MISAKRKEKITELLFGLSDENTNSRNFWRIVLALTICMTLSVISMGFTILGGVENSAPRLIVIVISLIKYFPILWVINNFAKMKAAHYLSDIFEISNDEAALNFIENVAFGNSGKSAKAEGKITVKDGKLSEDDLESPIIQISGPGSIKVGLDYLVVFENVNGRASIFYPRDKPWKIGKYERIREIGDQKYAIINLRDQFINNISIKSRTKDGIPIEARDIKIIFSILRRQQKDDSIKDESALLYEPDAAKALVYGQTIITSEISKTFGTTFPWDSTVIPLIVSEIENIIKTRPLNEILANIGQKEVEARAKNNESIETIKVEITGQQKAVSPTPEKIESTPAFETRSTITARFYESEFVKKASLVGIQLQWIDIGTWKLPSNKIIEKHKDAWNHSRDNAVRKMRIEKIKSKQTQKEFAHLVDETIINTYEKAMGIIGANQMEEEDKEAEAGLFLDISNTRRLRREETEKHPESLALEILKAFRKELSVVNKNLIPDENKSAPNSIENALQHINSFTSHFIGPKQNK